MAERLIIVVEKVFQQLLAFFGKYRFGMKLHAFDRKGFVAHRHDDAVGSPRADG